MNNQSPLIPQGSPLEQKNKGRARVKIAVFFVLAIHGIGLMALLMQGCGQPKEPITSTENPISNTPPAFVETTNPPVTTNNPPVVVTAPAPVETPAPSAVPAGATEYAIVKGDSFSTIARKFHVSAKAIADANPGVESTKLQIGQKIHIPAAAAPTAPVASGTAPLESASAGGEQTYTVKSGDNLTKIAGQFGTTIKALRTANGLKTDNIKVGQKLKIPAKTSAPGAVPAAPMEPAPTSPPVSTPTTTPER
ncbi:MAG: LysM peptidoglycan-binding domain-containing protein [Limisphaerales bacterium]